MGHFLVYSWLRKQPFLLLHSQWNSWEYYIRCHGMCPCFRFFGFYLYRGDRKATDQPLPLSRKPAPIHRMPADLRLRVWRGDGRRLEVKWPACFTVAAEEEGGRGSFLAGKQLHVFQESSPDLSLHNLTVVGRYQRTHFLTDRCWRKEGRAAWRGKNGPAVGQPTARLFPPLNWTICNGAVSEFLYPIECKKGSGQE